MTVTEINIYPVKGMRATACEFAAVEPRGLTHDRRYLVVDSDDTFITQRNDPILATIIPEIVPGGLRLTRPDMPSLALRPTSEKRKKVTIWKDEVDALDCGDEAANWLSEVVGKPCRLVFMDDDAVRMVDPNFGTQGEQVSFADGFPLLLVNEASLRDLNERMPEPLPMNRFRGNVVISSDEPWGEDRWAKIQIGDVTFRNVKPCARCRVTTTDQRTGERIGDEPLRTLAMFRNIDGKVMFGVNLIPDAVGTISVGDAVRVL